MAETSKKDDTKSLADRLVSDPRNPPDLSMLQGWLGASSEDKHRRLYLDPELSQSLEIPDDAIVHTQKRPNQRQPAWRQLGVGQGRRRDQAGTWTRTYRSRGSYADKFSRTSLPGPVLAPLVALAGPSVHRLPQPRRIRSSVRSRRCSTVRRDRPGVGRRSSPSVRRS